MRGNLAQSHKCLHTCQAIEHILSNTNTTHENRSPSGPERVCVSISGGVRRGRVMSQWGYTIPQGIDAFHTKARATLL